MAYIVDVKNFLKKFLPLNPLPPIIFRRFNSWCIFFAPLYLHDTINPRYVRDISLIFRHDSFSLLIVSWILARKCYRNRNIYLYPAYFRIRKTEQITSII